MSKFDDLIESVFGSLVSEQVPQPHSPTPSVDIAAQLLHKQVQGGDKIAHAKLRNLGAKAERNINLAHNKANKELADHEKQIKQTGSNTSRA
tara:strand:+ start:83 stop:358 length:276 start_codon:yes stop_codon:yes gene_type:complete